MRSPLKSGLAAACVSLALVSVPVSSANAARINYANCTQLAKDFKHGVAKSRAASQKQVNQGYGRPAYGKHAQKVYWANYRSMDRDKDGTACER